MCVYVLGTQSCLTLCDPIDCSPQTLSMGLSRQEYKSELPFPSPGDLPDPGLLHYRQILYHLSYQGSPYTLSLRFESKIINIKSSILLFNVSQKDFMLPNTSLLSLLKNLNFKIVTIIPHLINRFPNREL